MRKPKLQPTFYEKQKWYSLTIKPIDKHQYIHKEDRLSRFVQFVNEQLLCWDTYKFKYRLYVDISEPKQVNHLSVGPRLHLHGIILFPCTKSVLNWSLYAQTRLGQWSSIDIDTVKDMEHWIGYCSKYKKYTKLKSFKNTKLKTVWGPISNETDDNNDK